MPVPSGANIRYQVVSATASNPFPDWTHIAYWKTPDDGAVWDGPPVGTTWDAYVDALQRAIAKLRAQRVDAVVVSLGVDTFEGDPISRFRLQHDDFLRIGEQIAALGLPTLFVLEGGYAVDAIGVNAVNVLTGFEGA